VNAGEIEALTAEWRRQSLEQERARFEAGDRMALFAAIRVCANFDLPLPEWASRAFIAGYDKVLNCRARSWDEAFGQPYLKGANLAATRKRRTLRTAVWNDVMAAIKRDPERPVDESLFEEVGKAHATGKTLTAELYYEAVGLIGLGASDVKAALTEQPTTSR
jgi:hypothetical protein